MAKNNNGKSYADEKKKASELGKKRQAKFEQFCAANKKANPKLKSCGITPAQREILDGMMTTGQKALYAKGRTDFSTHQRPVTYVDGVKKKSNHQAKDGNDFGDAFDVYIYCHETKRASWNVDRLTKLAEHIIKVAAANGVKLSWGGHWTKFKDYPHFEYKGEI